MAARIISTPRDALSRRDVCPDFPPKRTAGLERFLGKGNKRSPLPPAKTSARTPREARLLVGPPENGTSAKELERAKRERMTVGDLKSLRGGSPAGLSFGV